jgi:hypothetical protein
MPFTGHAPSAPPAVAMATTAKIRNKMGVHGHAFNCKSFAN